MAEETVSKLRAKNGFIVSAETKDGETRPATISSARGGPLRLVSPFGGNDDTVQQLASGESVTLNP